MLVFCAVWLVLGTMATAALAVSDHNGIAAGIAVLLGLLSVACIVGFFADYVIKEVRKSIAPNKDKQSGSEQDRT
jgi:Na+-translocating ferredoxin:NAD+ oxidoreductase RnfE subunit